MCNLTKVKAFFKPKIRQIATSMVIAGGLFWAGWMQFGDTEHPVPVIIAWNLLLGGIGMFFGEIVALVLLKTGIVKRRNSQDQKQAKNDAKNDAK